MISSEKNAYPVSILTYSEGLHTHCVHCIHSRNFHKVLPPFSLIPEIPITNGTATHNVKIAELQLQWSLSGAISVTYVKLVRNACKYTYVQVHKSQ